VSSRGFLSIVTLLFASLGSAPARADSVVAQLKAPSPIAAYAGTQAFSVSDGRVYHLAIRRAGSVELLPVATSKSSFDADIGPDARGRPMLVYSRCKVESATQYIAAADARCDIVSYSLSGAGVERPVRGANTPASEVLPTVWMGRIAFVRVAKGRRFGAVYTRMLDAPPTTRSRLLPGVPRHIAGHEPTRSGAIEDLDLYGNTLAEHASYDAPFSPGGGARYEEIRVVGVRSRATRSVFRTGIGIAAQMLAGVGFADGYLGFAFGCVYGCEQRRPDGIYRYGLRTRKLERAPFSRLVETDVVGMALDSPTSAYTIDALVTADGCGPALDGSEGDRSCPIVFASDLRFKPVG